MADIRVYFIPADTDKPMEVKIIDGGDWRVMKDLVGGFVQVVPRATLPTFKQGPQMVMLVDEEGQLKGREHNPRANILAPWHQIVGDVLLAGTSGVNFVSLPEAIVDWDGPGSPLPAGC